MTMCNETTSLTIFTQSTHSWFLMQSSFFEVGSMTFLPEVVKGERIIVGITLNVLT